MADFDVSVVVRLVDQVSSRARQVASSLKQVEMRLTAMGTRMQTVGRSMMLGVTAPLVAVGYSGIKMVADYQQQMLMVQALTNATEDEFEQLKSTAVELGAATVFSASEVAEAMRNFAKSGFEVNEIIGTMPAAMDMAAAAQLSMADTARITANVLRSQRMDVSETGHVVDVLTKAFTTSSVNLNELAEAFKYVGPISKTVGISFEETTAALGLMGNQGIQSSMAGTSLRMALLRLVNPPKEAADVLKKYGIVVKDSEGRLLSLAEILDNVGEKTNDTADIAKLFGVRATAAMSALLAVGGGALRDFTDEVNDSFGTARRIGEAAMSGLAGKMEELSGAWESLRINMYESDVGDWIEDLVDRITEYVRQMSELHPTTLREIAVFGALAAAAGPVIWAFGKLITLVTALGSSLLSSPVGWALAGIAAGLYSVWKNWHIVKPAWDELLVESNKLWRALEPLRKEIAKFTGLEGLNLENWDMKTAETIKEALKGLETVIKDIRELVENPLDFSNWADIASWFPFFGPGTGAPKFTEEGGRKYFVEPEGGWPALPEKGTKKGIWDRIKEIWSTPETPAGSQVLPGHKRSWFGSEEEWKAPPGWASEMGKEPWMQMPEFAFQTYKQSPLANVPGAGGVVPYTMGAGDRVPVVPGVTEPGPMMGIAGSIVQPYNSPSSPYATQGSSGMLPGAGVYDMLINGMRDLTQSMAPAKQANAAPVSGAPPPGITMEARGHQVTLNQAPPSINNVVTVNVTKPDEAPSATATAVGLALTRRQIRASLSDGNTEVA